MMAQPIKFSLSVSAPIELLEALRTVDITVPGRSEGRKSGHCENWSICRFLSSFCEDGILIYPLEVDGSGESPDFRLTLNGHTAGIEVTQACHEGHSEARTHAEKTPYSVLELSQFKPGVKTNARHVFRSHAGSSRRGLELECDWVVYISAAIDKKTKKLGSSNFIRFEEDWLLIYDNTPCFNLHVDDAVSMLTRHLESYWTRETKFTGLLIEVSEFMIHITATSSRILPLTDVSAWQ